MMLVRLVSLVCFQVDPLPFPDPQTTIQFRRNIEFIFSDKAFVNPDLASRILDGYLGNAEWPKTEPRGRQIPKARGKPIGLEEFKAFYAKNRGVLNINDQRKLDDMRARFSPRLDAEEKQKALVEKMEKGIVNRSVFFLPGGNSPVKFHNGGWHFKDPETKDKTIAFEKEVLKEIQEAIERQDPTKPQPKDTFYQPPRDANYKPKTKAEARRAYDEASFWLDLARDVRGLKESTMTQLFRNKLDKEKEWTDFQK